MAAAMQRGIVRILGLLLAVEALAIQAADAVELREGELVLPTYLAGPPDPVPRFYQGRTYQGARATFYPYPVQDRLTDVKEDRRYRAVFLGNRYLQLTILPELGGRILSAVDKANGYDFFYRQNVVKPALIGMLGAWISGGVEWNVPHHHRATSFMPVDCALEEHPDGSKTAWVGEIEWRHRLKWEVGLTLYPERSYLEISARVFNRTPLAQSFLFWINPAVHANTNYQVLFPPDARFAVQHGKPEFARWPVAREVYGGTDYTAGVDISWWKNHPSPVSFFCFHSDEDFFGGYDHGRQAGVLHWADHHAVPGKKFFEWGNGPEGEAWSRILTDADGPYLELMAGAYSDNQPDYSWLRPGEVKTWKHFWYPIRELGGVKAATVDAALNLDVTNQTLRLALNATAEFAGARARLRIEDRVLLDQALTLGPTRPFVTNLVVDGAFDATRLEAVLAANDGRELVAYRPVAPTEPPLPEPAGRPAPPKDIATVEELDLTGQRIEQLYSPAFEAAPYYLEALRRDPGDSRANTALGVLRARAGRWEEAERYLRAAADRLTAHYIRPKEVEAFYYLGVVRFERERLDEAYDAFQRATWDPAWQPAGCLALARIDARRGHFESALQQANRAIAAGALNTAARNLKAALLRRLQRFEEAEELARSTLAFDPLDAHAAHELALAQRQKGDRPASERTLVAWRARLRGDPQVHLELASDYGRAGLWPEAAEVLERFVDGPGPATNASLRSLAGAASGAVTNVNPLVFYHLGYYQEMSGQIQSLKSYRQAARQSPDFCFPFRWEEERILRRAIEWDPEDGRAWYYLGNLLYDHQPEAAIEAWEASRAAQPGFALVHRNLGLAYAQTRHDATAAVASLEKAVELDPRQPRFLYELDVQYEAAGMPLAQRLEMLTNHHDVAVLRDDALSREIRLLAAAAQADRALDLLQTHRFHNWEGSAEIHSLYVDVLLVRGQARARRGEHAAALKDYEAALEYPPHLEVGRPRRERRAGQVAYFIGTAQEGLGDAAKAREAYERAVERIETAPSEAQYHQALALRKLGRNAEAERVFEGLVRRGEGLVAAGEPADYFAKFGEKQAERVRQAQGHYLVALGRLGLDRKPAAQAALSRALELDPAHLGALVAAAAIE
jgi:tetratricopeptide (TPR) repeat protein